MASSSPDPGLAYERTVLAWNRSGLAVIVCIAVLVRHLWPLRGAGQDVALAFIAAAAVVWAVASLAFSWSRVAQGLEAARRPRMFSLMTAGTELLAFGGLVLSFFPPS
jgi:uncharacterized membrane protein YidH (DUF202 family)